ncbi:MAG TPA: hypothetical protein VN108_00185 [Marmoricola sp.]|nr:hypothetical protein [Marmoricola sp.]
MYGASSSASINAGVPSAIGVLAATGQWNLITGVALAMAGLTGAVLALRSRRQMVRDFD